MAKGKADAEADIQAGLLKQKEYPPMPYSLEMINFIKHIKADCGVVWEVLPMTGSLDPNIQAEVTSYNAAMRVEIQKRFGPDIFAKLEAKAKQ